jgi:sugar O-acyltransferase (sialic acid O-acetyltransferase NeuD family)
MIEQEPTIVQTHLIIVGAGGFGLEVAVYAEDIIRLRGVDFEIAGFLDDTKPIGTAHGGYSVIGTTEGELDETAIYAIALGAPTQRRKMVEKLRGRGAKFATLMHPAAYIAHTATIGLGCIIAPFAFVGPDAIVGAQVVVNVGAMVAHEAQVGDCSVLAPHANVQGAVQLDADVFVGAGAVVTHSKTIGAGSMVAPNAVVQDHVAALHLAIGNPATSTAY